MASCRVFSPGKEKVCVYKQITRSCKRFDTFPGSRAVYCRAGFITDHCLEKWKPLACGRFFCFRCQPYPFVFCEHDVSLDKHFGTSHFLVETSGPHDDFRLDRRHIYPDLPYSPSGTLGMDPFWLYLGTDPGWDYPQIVRQCPQAHLNKHLYFCRVAGVDSHRTYY